MVFLYSLDLTENILIFYIRILHCFDIKARLVRKSDLRAHHSRTLQLHSSSDSTIIKQLLAPGLPSIPCVLPVSWVQTESADISIDVIILRLEPSLLLCFAVDSKIDPASVEQKIPVVVAKPQIESSKSDSSFWRARLIYRRQGQWWTRTKTFRSSRPLMSFWIIFSKPTEKITSWPLNMAIMK